MKKADSGTAYFHLFTDRYQRSCDVQADEKD